MHEIGCRTKIHTTTTPSSTTMSSGNVPKIERLSCVPNDYPCEPLPLYNSLEEVLTFRDRG